MKDLTQPIEQQPGTHSLDRREFLGLTAGLAATLGAPGLVRSARAQSTAGKGKAHNLIFCVSDGMSSGTLTMADMLIRRKSGKPSRWLQLQAQDGTRRAMLNTSAADSLVTDSAAAATQTLNQQAEHARSLREQQRTQR